jgi:hypothetical protein
MAFFSSIRGLLGRLVGRKPVAAQPIPQQPIQPVTQEPQSRPEPEPGSAEQWAMNGSWLRVASSNVAEIRYLMAEEILEVEFQDNRYYQYEPVPMELAIRMAESDSPGRFIWNHFRDLIPYVRMTFAGKGNRPQQSYVVRRRNENSIPEVKVIGLKPSPQNTPGRWS